VAAIVMAAGFGIIGCGMISQFHARAIADVRGAKLVACFDMRAEVADRFAAANRCTPYDRLDAMLADERVSMVTIATPSGAHMEPAVAAARAGKHVIVEKPLDITLKRCDRMIRECQRAGVQLGTIFPSRFHEASVRLKRAIDAGRFGRLALGDAVVKWFRSQEYYDSGAWRGTWALDGGGALMNQGIHSVDLLTWLMGPVVEIQARAATLAHKRIEVEDTVVATLRFKNGALGVLEATTAAFPGYLKRIEIHGSDGSAVLEEETLKSWDFAKPQAADRAVRKLMDGRGTSGGGAGDPSAIGHHGHARQFQDFVAAVRAGRRPAIDGLEGRRSVEIVLGVYKAAETGRAIKLPLRTDPVLRARAKRAK
jgi:predicted dehydrogenase